MSAADLPSLDPNAPQEEIQADRLRFKAELAAPAEPAIERRGLGYRLSWPAGIAVDVSRVRSNTDAMKAELVVSLEGKTLLRSNVNLLAARSVKDLVKNLSERTPDRPVPWDRLISQTVEAVISNEREGEPAIRFADLPPAPPPSFLLGLFPKGSPAVIYADGGTGKSYLAAALGSIVASGWKGNPLRLPVGNPAPVLILDWETSQDDAQWRIEQLHRGMGYPVSQNLHYRRCGQALADDLEAVSELVAREKIELCIVDSLAPASGGEPSAAETALRFFQAVRHLKGCTVLCLAHVSKNQEGRKTIFGSAFFSNLARATFELRKQQKAGDHQVELGLFHTKANSGPILRPIGLTLTYAGDEVRLALSAEPNLEDFTTTGGPSQSQRIVALLRTEGALNTPGIAEALSIEESAVRTACYRLKKQGKITQTEIEGKPSRWTLPGDDVPL